MFFQPAFRRATFLFVFALAPVGTLSAQFQPAAAHVNLYFPHVVEGGSQLGRWQTTITFTNPGDTESVVKLDFYADNGSPLRLDFGHGPASALTVTVPPRGVRIVETSWRSSEPVTGWAFGDASAPLLATVTFTSFVNDVPQQSVAASPTVSSHNYLYPANAFLGLAVVNPYDGVSISIRISVRDHDGVEVANERLTLPANGHVSFSLYERFPQLGYEFVGSVRLSPDEVALESFLAWAVTSNGFGLLSALPDGGFQSPPSAWDEIWRTFQTTMRVAQPYLGPEPIELFISVLPTVNAFAADGNRVVVTLALGELLAESPSELAFVVGHELGHIYQQRTGRLEFRPDNVESDADLWGVLFSIGSGYDVYAAAGALAKLAMATGRASLTTQVFEDMNVAEAHLSFSTRSAEIFDSLVLMCSLPELQATCAVLKKLQHPFLPPPAPLAGAPPTNRKKR